jgi:shikimate dehydrogenase
MGKINKNRLNSVSLAVLGKPVSHSLSPAIHQHFAEQFGRAIDYQKIEIASKEAFIEFIAKSADRYCGFNVTVPYKQTLFDYALEKCEQFSVTAIAEQAKAANTVVYSASEGKPHFVANTDGEGFLKHLAKLAVPVHQQKILILGAGGATMGLLAQFSVLARSADFQGEIYLCNRTAEKAKSIAEHYNIHYWGLAEDEGVDVQFDLVINATAQGLDGSAYQNNHFTKEHIHPKTYFYDLFYQKQENTSFLNYVRKNYPQHPYSDGLGMLIEQAALSYQLWFGDEPTTDLLYAQLRL